MQNGEPKSSLIEIPSDKLSVPTLDALIQSFIMREGTDYGAVEISFDTKFAQIKKQIETGRVKIIFDPAEQSATLMTELDFQRLSRKF